jgi:O-antigen/teichoic acid export membrane protein
MISKKEQKDTILTIFSKGVIVVANFLITACIMHFWGAEGKGYQAIFIANLGFIAIVTNIFTNSSVSYFIRKVGASKLYAQACLWTFISSSIGVLVCYFLPNNPSLPVILLISSLLTGYLTFHNALYIGMQKIKYFNLITVLQPLFLLIFIFLLYKTTNSTYFDYFYAHIFSLILVILIAHIFTRKTVGKIKIQLDFSVTKQSFNYGFQNELSNFFHYLVLRLSYYFIVYYISEAAVGVFSVGISISEAIWHISRSISMVQYSKIIKEGNTQSARKGIVTSSFISIVFSMCCILILLLLPNFVFTDIFTDECSNVKQIILLMSPGILSISFSSVYAHYFAALGKMRILVLKSVIGAILTAILLVFFIPLWNINGACITSSIVHFVCSAIIVGYFIIFKEKATIYKHPIIND